MQLSSLTALPSISRWSKRMPSRLRHLRMIPQTSLIRFKRFANIPCPMLTSRLSCGQSWQIWNRRNQFLSHSINFRVSGADTSRLTWSNPTLRSTIKFWMKSRRKRIENSHRSSWLDAPLPSSLVTRTSRTSNSCSPRPTQRSTSMCSSSSNSLSSLTLPAKPESCARVTQSD